MKIKANITISRNSNDEINITLQDDESRIQFVDFKITPENLAYALTGQAYIPLEGEVRGLEYVGKKKVSETRSIVYPLPGYSREEMKKWLIENAQEEGWIIDPYLGTQSSIGRDSFGLTVLNYRVYKYVDPEGKE